MQLRLEERLRLHRRSHALTDALFPRAPSHSPSSWIESRYVEFFCHPRLLSSLIEAVEQQEKTHGSHLTYLAADVAGNQYANYTGETTALTWGVFPNIEVQQPTVLDLDSFLAWKDEAFDLWKVWADVYSDESPSYALIHEVRLRVRRCSVRGAVPRTPPLLSHSRVLTFLPLLQIRRTYFLVSLVDNNFVDGDIFAIFDQVAKGWRANAGPFERSTSGRKRGGSTGSRGSTGSGIGSGGGDDYRDGRISPTPPYRFGRSHSLSGGSIDASDWVDESI